MVSAAEATGAQDSGVSPIAAAPGQLLPARASRPRLKASAASRLLTAVTAVLVGVLVAMALILLALVGAVVGVLLTAGALFARLAPLRRDPSLHRAPEGWTWEVAPRLASARD